MSDSLIYLYEDLDVVMTSMDLRREKKNYDLVVRRVELLEIKKRIDLSIAKINKLLKGDVFD